METPTLQQPYIPMVSNGQGIVDAFITYPETAVLMNALAQHLLNTDRFGLSKAYRESIAAYTSMVNETNFCYLTHSRVAILHDDEGFMLESEVKDVIRAVINNYDNINFTISILAKMKTPDQIHDIIAIISAFCMFNTYVKGLGLDRPSLTQQEYEQMAKQLAEKGYQ